MTKSYTWEIIPRDFPRIRRKCPKCNFSEHYYCSGKFRLNSNKKRTDVWLLYRCVRCDDTWNARVLSRVRSDAIAPELFSRFTVNDRTTALRFSLDPAIVSMNGMEIDYSRFAYEVAGDAGSPEAWEEILAAGQPVTIRLVSQYDMALKVSAVIKRCFGISAARLDKLAEAGVIRTDTGAALKKCKIGRGITLHVHDPGR